MFIFNQDNSFHNNNITSRGANILFNNLPQCGLIKELCLSYNNIDDNCMESLGIFTKEKKMVRSIDICGNYQARSGRISDRGIQAIAPYIFGNESLRQINISYNSEITDQSLPMIKQWIERSRIEYVSISETRITLKNQLVTPMIRNRIKNDSFYCMDFQSR